MAQVADDWGAAADLQEKNIKAFKERLTLDDVPIPPPVPATVSLPKKTVSPTAVSGSAFAGANSNSAAAIHTTATATGATNDDDNEPSLAEVSLMNKLFRSQLLTTTNELDIEQKNPNSPLYSVKSFEELNLCPELLKGVYDMGFNYPSKIQELALPTLIADPPQNMIAQSQSGTGKTAAFVLASLSRINPNLKSPQVLVLSPTYELAIQTGEVAKQMAKFYPDVEFVFAVRGVQLERGTKVKAQYIIGTPGKVFDWAMKFKFFDITKINVFVLDEADVMISTQGYQDQSIRIHKQLRRDCQMMLFSATYSEEVMEFAELIIRDPIIIKLKREEESLHNIKQYYIVCKSPEEKFEALSNIYGAVSIGQAIIFCHTKHTANWLVDKMSKEGHNVALLSGELTVEQRIAILNRFRDGREKVLITTNVCARGIDIEQVTVVINFDLPVVMSGNADCETYLHRIGRTGRFGKKGLAINMVDGNKSMAVLRQIESHFGKKIQKVDANEVDDLEEIGRV